MRADTCRACLWVLIILTLSTYTFRPTSCCTADEFLHKKPVQVQVDNILEPMEPNSFETVEEGVIPEINPHKLPEVCVSAPAEELIEPIRNGVCHLEGAVDECCNCTYEATNEINKKLNPILQELVKTAFFRYFKVNIYCDCPLWPDDSMCMNRACSVCECDDNEIPRPWRDIEKTAAASCPVQKRAVVHVPAGGGERKEAAGVDGVVVSSTVWGVGEDEEEEMTLRRVETASEDRGSVDGQRFADADGVSDEEDSDDDVDGDLDTIADSGSDSDSYLDSDSSSEVDEERSGWGQCPGAPDEGGDGASEGTCTCSRAAAQGTYPADDRELSEEEAVVSDAADATASVADLSSVNSTVDRETAARLLTLRGWRGYNNPWMAEGDAHEEFLYINLLVNPERFTGYSGEHAHRIWNSIYGLVRAAGEEPAAASHGTGRSISDNGENPSASTATAVGVAPRGDSDLRSDSRRDDGGGGSRSDMVSEDGGSGLEEVAPSSVVVIDAGDRHQGSNDDYRGHDHHRRSDKENDRADEEGGSTEEGSRSGAPETRVFSRLVSGMHASISAHISANYLLDEANGLWGHNLTDFRIRLGLPEHRERVENLYFAYLFVLRAVTKALPLLNKFHFYTGIPGEDIRTRELFRRLHELDEIQHACPTPFDEGRLWKGRDAERLKERLRGTFQNITRVMDCVGCEKCKLWGKLQTLGIATALKILFSASDCGGGPPPPGSAALVLERNEVIALVNLLERFSNSIRYVNELSAELALAGGVAAPAVFSLPPLLGAVF